MPMGKASPGCSVNLLDTGGMESGLVDRLGDHGWIVLEC